MPPATWFLIGAGIAAVVDWWSVSSRNRRIELWAKPLTMALLVGVAAAAGDASGDVRTALVVGACFGLLGDIALLSDSEPAFIVGLGSFSVGHIAYVVAALLVGFDPAWALAGVVFVIGLFGFRFISRTLPGAHAHGGSALAGAVLFYAVVISAMVVTAWATEAWIAAVGAMLFAISDWLIGYQRFVRPLPNGRLAIIVPYHVGQALLILGIVTA